MGTNFYVDDDATCNNPAHTRRLHIGKSSGGWKFGFEAIPDRGLTSWAAWREFLTGRAITDEYGQTRTVEEFAALVTAKQEPITRESGPYAGTEPAWCHVQAASALQVQRNGPPQAPGSTRWFHDPEGFDFGPGGFS